MAMFIAALILIISTGMFLFYIHAICQRILRREFDKDYYLAIVNANRLEFPTVRRAVESWEAPVDYAHVHLTLKCDYLALTYLLKNAVNVNRRYTRQEWLLVVYFHAILLLLGLCHKLRLGERSALLNLTAILQYFANVIGQRVSALRFGNLSAADYLLNL
jgi:hypothetical protein